MHAVYGLLPIVHGFGGVQGLGCKFEGAGTSVSAVFVFQLRGLEFCIRYCLR